MGGEKSSGLRIVELRASNVMGLRAVEIRPNGDPMVIIGGKNGQGKSSTLESIAMALGGKAVQPPRPVRDGAKKAEVVVELEGGLEVRRTFTESGGGTLIVTDATGTVKAPQALLDRLWGGHTRDPLAFARAKPKDQAEQLREMTGLDLSELDAKRSSLYAARTELGRIAKAARARCDGLIVHADAPEEEVDAAELVARLREAQAQNRKNGEARAWASRSSQRYEEQEAHVRQAELALAKMRDELEETRKAATEAAHAVRDLVDVDTAAIEAELAGVSATNRKVADNRKAREALEEVEAAEAKALDMTQAIEAVDAQKAAALEAAKMPVKGLSFDGEQVYFKGVPFAQCSAAEQLKVSVALCLRSNPGIRVLLIREGSLLDEDSLALIAKMAAKYEAQVWVERVGTKDPAAIVIENGVVASAASAADEVA